MAFRVVIILELILDKYKDMNYLTYGQMFMSCFPALFPLQSKVQVLASQSHAFVHGIQSLSLKKCIDNK